jgi:hypothetical protein
MLQKKIKNELKTQPSTLKKKYSDRYHKNFILR